MVIVSKAERIRSITEDGVDFPTRTIYLHGEIDREKFTQFSTNLKIMNESKGPITIDLFSEGGDYAAGFATYDAIKASKNPVTIEGTGEIFSMAAVIFQGGDKRLLTPESRIMIHNVYVVMPDEKLTSQYLKRYAREIDALSRRYQHVLVEKTGLPIRTIRAWCEKEKYMSAQEAVQLGFADGIKE